PFLLNENPYTGEAATQATTFKKLHPHYDGRGVVIGLTELADPLAPSMHGALGGGGNPTSKFLTYSWGSPDIVGAANEAERDVKGFYWQSTVLITPEKNGQFEFAGHRYSLPVATQAKEWRVCIRYPTEWEKNPPYIV